MRKLIACLFVKFFFCSLYSVIHEEYILHTWRIYTSQISFFVELATNYKVGRFFVTVLFILYSFYSMIYKEYIFCEEYILYMWRIYTSQISFSVELATNYKERVRCFFVAVLFILFIQWYMKNIYFVKNIYFIREEYILRRYLFLLNLQ